MKLGNTISLAMVALAEGRPKSVGQLLVVMEVMERADDSSSASSVMRNCNIYNILDIIR